MLKVVLLIIWLLSTLAKNSSTTEITCSYEDRGFWAATTMYSCMVSQQLNIDTYDKALITGASGSHLPGKSQDSEIVFHSENGIIHFFPRGLEKIHKNLNGICLYYGKFNSIQQSDLKAYTKLIFLQIAKTEIDVLEDGLFEYNLKLKYLALNENKIVHIGLSVFDNLVNLQSLYLNGNKCIDRKIVNNAAEVFELIKEIKTKCINSEYQKLDTEIKSLESNFSVQSLKEQVDQSNFTNKSAWNSKLENLRLKIEEYHRTTSTDLIATTSTDEFEKEQAKVYESLDQCTMEVMNQFKDSNSLIDDFKFSVSASLSKLDEKLDEKFNDIEQRLLESEKILIQKMEDMLAKNVEKILNTLSANLRLNGTAKVDLQFF